MAEAVVSAILEQLVSILHQQVEGGIRLIVDAEEEVQKLHSNFLAIQAVLEDAESKQVKDKAVRDWLDKLKDVCYDIDDVLDEWNTAMQKLRLKQVENTSKVCSLTTPPCYCFSCGRVLFRRDIAVKIKDLNRTLDVIAIAKDRFNFSLTKGSERLERQITTSGIDVSEVCGRDDDRITLIKLLLTESSQGPAIPIISIAGMGGIGKTTLASMAFHDYRVKNDFDVRIWVCVSDPFNETRVAKAILESLTNEAPNLDQLETVLRNISVHVQEKRFLLVLDDVWTEDPNDWEQIKHALKYGSRGSRILVTTRKENVVNAIGTSHVIPMGTLPENDCWSLFNKVALSGRSVEEGKSLEDIGRKIVDRCKGLPLAIKTLASLLRFKRKVEEWQNVLDNKLWELEEVEKGVFPPLLLSYYDLPSILKKCFSYCAIFPKSYNILKNELIRLWMAQGYLNAEPYKNAESVGEKYFGILAMRSFFQDFQRDVVSGHIISCKMHDIVHEFAQFLTKNECIIIEVDYLKKSQLESHKKARHSMIIPKEKTSFPSSIYAEKKLRSLVVEWGYLFRDVIVLSTLFDQLTCLRTLKLSGDLSIDNIPKEIKKLIHLRYLNLARNKNIKELPEELCELCNLQILNLNFCQNLQKLPEGIGKLVNLSHLLNHMTSLSHMPIGMKRLTCLETLSEFVVSNGGYDSKACKLECLENFDLSKSIRIKGLGNLSNVGEFKRAEINKKENLIELGLSFEGRMNEGQEFLLEAMQPPPNLEELVIENYRGKNVFPNWIVSLTKLKHVGLDSCINCEHLPPLGKLSSLESLYIGKMKSVRRVGDEFLGIENDGSGKSSSSPVVAFPKLKFLEFWNMEEWEEWDYGITKTGKNHVKIMPCLSILGIYSCPKLKSMPRHLLPMRMSSNFRISECRLLRRYLQDRKLN